MLKKSKEPLNLRNFCRVYLVSYIKIKRVKWTRFIFVPRVFLPSLYENPGDEGGLGFKLEYNGKRLV